MNPSRSLRPSRRLSRLCLLARGCFLVAFLASAGLGWRSFSGLAAPGCGVGSGCGSVLSSAWAWIGPVPVALLGALVYALCFAVSGKTVRPVWLHRHAPSLLAIPLAAAVFFAGVQALVLKQWCPWCCGIHLLGVVGALAALRARQIAAQAASTDPAGAAAPPIAPGLVWGAAGALGVLGLGALFLPGPRSGAAVAISRQAAPVLVPADPATASATAAPRVVRLHEGRFQFIPGDLPTEGDPAADHLILAITDPTCPHCRATGQTLRAALAGYRPGRLAILFLPGTRDPLLGPALQRLLLTVWKEKPAAWHDLTRRLDAEQLPATLDALRAAAAEALGGAATLDTALRRHHAWAEGHLSATTGLMAANAHASGRDITLPQTLIGQNLLFGALAQPPEVQHWTQEEFQLVASQPLALAETSGTPETAADTATPPATRPNPCNPRQRAFCGRLRISILGAGEIAHSAGGDGPGVKDDANEYEGFYNFKQFSPHMNSTFPSHHVAISSDTGFNQSAKKEPTPANSQHMGAVPNSKDALADFFSRDIQKSLLQKTIQKFANDPNCRKLMKEKGLANVLPLLKVEILVDGEYAEDEQGQPALPSWQSKSDIGTVDKWRQNQATLSGDQWKDLMGILQGSVVQTFFKSCKAGAIAAAYERKSSSVDSCSCFLASASPDEDDFGGGTIAPAWNYAILDNGKKLADGKVRNYWAGAGSVSAMLSNLYSKYSRAIVPDRGVTVFGDFHLSSDRRNPLMGYVYTSIDALAEESLKKMPAGTTQAKVAQEYLGAEFTTELPKLDIDVRTDGGERSANYARIMDHVASMERSFSPVLKSERAKKFETATYDKNIKAFAVVYNSELKEKYNPIGTKVDANDNPSSIERNFAKSNTAFIGSLKDNKIGGIWADFLGNKISAPDLLKKLDQTWTAFSQFKNDLVALELERSGPKKQVPKAIQQQMDKMTDSFAAAFASVREQLFEYLRREAMEVKLAKIRGAAFFLEQGAGFPRDFDRERMLARIASALDCLTQYPVGPMLDADGPGPVQTPEMRKTAKPPTQTRPKRR